MNKNEFISKLKHKYPKSEINSKTLENLNESIEILLSVAQHKKETLNKDAVEFAAKWFLLSDYPDCNCDEAIKHFHKLINNRESRFLEYGEVLVIKRFLELAEEKKYPYSKTKEEKEIEQAIWKIAKHQYETNAWGVKPKKFGCIPVVVIGICVIISFIL